ncbi:MAG TPA: oligosaccharide deacetylase [Firmicutes bacterium]|jgi:peptidoglycan-N-acetylglucosamine deacetylase|nr:oligosaccharide deacetylase [Bacillota bacterium]
MVCCVLWFNSRPLLVYKDREQWEKIGAVVWEVSVHEKMVALTFDDGPSPTFTKRILDLLSKYKAKATFFVVGKQAEMYPDIILREYHEGHEIGNHTYSHPEVNRISFEALKEDLFHAHQIITQITGGNMVLFRPTSGFYDDKIVKTAHLLGYKVVIWTWGQDSRDWTGISGQSIAMRIIKTVKPGNIILFHDQGGNRSNTLKALEIILPVLAKQGYHFITVSTLLQKDLHKITN